jgi:hypothetical protein
LINIKMLGRILSPECSAERTGIRAGGSSMYKFMRGVAAVLICSAFGMAGVANSDPIGRVHNVSGLRGFHGFYRGFYPYTLFGYPNYHSYGSYYPYSLYEDDSPDCRFEWPKRAVKRKTAQRGVWTCS